MQNHSEKMHFALTIREFVKRPEDQRQSIIFDPKFKRRLQERLGNGTIHEIYQRGEGFFPVNRSFKSLIYDNKELGTAERDLLFYLILTVNPVNCILKKTIGEIAIDICKPLTKVSVSMKKLIRERLVTKIKYKKTFTAIMVNPGLMKHRNIGYQVKLENRFNQFSGV